MSITINLRKQHAEIAESVRRIETALDPQGLPRSAGEMRAHLSNLFGKLSLHLAIEDNSLYPSLEKHANARIREVGTKFARDMGGLKRNFDAFARKWTEGEIRANAAAFCAEAKKVFAALNERIKRENVELYPLLERAK